MMAEPYFSAMLALLAAIAWGVNGHIMKKAMVHENSMRAIGIRSAFTFPILFLIIYFLKGFEGITIYFSTKLFPFVTLTAVLIVIGDGIFLHGLKYYDVSVLLPIAGVYPFFTAIILISTKTEDLTNNILIGTLVIIFGVAIVTSGKGWDKFEHGAIKYGLGAAIAWATSIFFVKYILDQEKTDPIGLTGVRALIMGLTGFAIFYIFSPSQNNEQSQRNPKEFRNTVFLLAMSGIVGWVIGATIFFASVQRIGAAIPTPISSMNPVIASIIAIFFDIERVSTRQFIGIIGTVVGTIIILL